MLFPLKNSAIFWGGNSIFYYKSGLQIPEFVKHTCRSLVYNPLKGVLKGIQIRIFDPWFWLHPPCNQPDLIFKPNCCQMYPLDHLALAPAPEGSRNTYLFVCRIDTQIMGVWNKTKKGPLITLGVLIWQLFCFFDTMLLCSIPLFWNK